MSLSQNIHTLTRPHLPAGATLDSKPEPSLLDQLAKAVYDGAKGGKGNGTPIPISAEVVSIQQDIDRDARDIQHDLTGSSTGTLVGVIQSWADVEDMHWVAFLEHVTMDWVDQIEGIIRPHKPPYRPAVPCPSCDMIYNADGEGPGMSIHCWGPDDVMLPIGKWTAQCTHCNAGWGPDEMKWVRHALMSVA
ncbi:DUF7341 domain-containing protein [Arthrobacter roseus]|uniref:DUF7341 domain-containing protein n=1 Tax=Arthrobacter roseus TaxID=136274 RepID=UPI001964DDEC|nr:hypothetical protein [Arthrobacter roseus]MBM7847477.1 hypothetical protein [Arthrobacter roseus]